MPCGAATTGTRAYLSAMVARWKAATERFTSSKAPSAMAMVSIARLAPTEKFTPWFATTSPTPSVSARFTARWTMASTSPPMAFILVWNSRQKTPSPRSTTEAPGVPLHLGPALLEEQEVDAARPGAPRRARRSVAGSRVRRWLPSSA